MVLARGNASTSTSIPVITITDSTGTIAKQSGATGGCVNIHKLVLFGGTSLTITLTAENLTGGGNFNNYSRITIIRLKQ